jgi:protein SCO1
VKGSVRTTVLLCVAFVAIVLGAFLYSVLREPLLDDATLREQGTFILPTPRDIAPFALVDTRGEAFDNSRLLGHWSLLFFGYTSCPDICPVTLSVLAQMEKKLADGKDRDLLDQLEVYLISIDPERDSADALGKYLGAFSPRFTGVTGSRDAIAALATQLNVAFMKVPADNGSYVIDHTGNVVVVNPKGHYHAFIKLPRDPDHVLLAYRSMARKF